MSENQIIDCLHVAVKPDVCYRHELPANEMRKSRDDFLETNIVVKIIAISLRFSVHVYKRIPTTFGRMRFLTRDSRLIALKCLISVNRERTLFYVKV